MFLDCDIAGEKQLLLKHFNKFWKLFLTIKFVLLYVVFVDEIGGDEPESGRIQHGNCVWAWG